MRRRTLDILFSAGGMALAGLLVVLGVVMCAAITVASFVWARSAYNRDPAVA